MVISLFLLACVVSLSRSNFIAHDGAVNDYAEVRNILNQYYKITARKFGSFHDYDPKHVNVALQGTSFDDGTEASTNRKEGVAGDLFENDILLTLPQAQQLLREVRKRGPRQAQVGLQWFWPAEPISFTFAVYEPKWQNLIRRALRYVESETCMRFQENRNSRDYIQFIRGAGCWSSVGRVGGRQQISIGYGCEAIGIVAHETLHALGLWHEQSRSDRDQYITINYANIYPGLQGNFEKRSSWNTDNMGEPYDLGSVMHYGSKAFAIDYSRDTIRTIDRNFQRTIGQRGGMSFKDIKMINKRYCQYVCSPLPCQNGGYTNPNKCSECKCPKGYGGRYCERIETSVPSTCGGELIADRTFKQIASPPMSSNIRCIWRITSPAQVLVVVDHLNLPCEETCTNYVELKYANEKTSTGPRLCCMAPTASFISEGNEFIVIFNTANVDTRYQGMKIRYQAYGRLPSTKVPYTQSPTREASTVVTTTSSYAGAWSAWGGWSSCTQSCGGCGVRRRVRGCYPVDRKCEGPWYEDQPCGLTPCPDPIDGTYCEGKIVLPCDLMDRLKFGAAKYSSAVFNTPSLDSSAKNDVFKRTYENKQLKDFSGTKQSANSTYLCEKRFWYSCPTSMLTINIAWLRPGEVNHNIRGCCSGYYVSEGICKKTN